MFRLRQAQRFLRQICRSLLSDSGQLISFAAPELISRTKFSNGSLPEAVQANGSSVGHFHYTLASLPVLKAHFSSVQCGSSPHIQLPLLVRELLYGITQHSAGHHFAIFIQKLQQQGLVPLSHFTQHPAYSLPHQVMFVLQQQFRKTENIDEIVIPDEGNRRYDSNTLIPQQSTFRQPIKIITRLIL